MKTPIIFIILLVLTAFSALAANAHSSAAVLVGLGCVKLLLVAFTFMEIHKAHLVWKCLIVIIPAALLTASIIVLQ